MFRIRFHGRGGQGMKTASRVLGTGFFIEGFEIQDAPRYGAERRGAPIFAYVRASRHPINERGIIRDPDLVVVADDSLVPIPAAGVLEGLDEHTVLLINSHDTPAMWVSRLNLSGPVLILPASETMQDRAALPFVGVTCAGAAARLTGVIGRDALRKAICDELRPLGKGFVDKNLQLALRTYDIMDRHAGLVTEAKPISAGAYDPPSWVTTPFETVDLSAPTVHGAATSLRAKTGLWRTMRPVIDSQRCRHCWWVCSTFCPDNAIKVDTAGRPEIDYEHCKGCLICVSQCPPHAIEAVPEHLAQAAEEHDR